MFRRIVDMGDVFGYRESSSSAAITPQTGWHHDHRVGCRRYPYGCGSSGKRGVGAPDQGVDQPVRLVCDGSQRAGKDYRRC
ncbi:hypothetical protein DESC_370138 [Desulfosarcina cetonica]|nr:hypothetical protein DESC_370138 [Desulfosarcina cetonica]